MADQHRNSALQNHLAEALALFVHMMGPHVSIDVRRPQQTAASASSASAASNFAAPANAPATAVSASNDFATILAQINIKLAQSADKRRLPQGAATKLWSLLYSQLAALHLLASASLNMDNRQDDENDDEDNDDSWDANAHNLLHIARRLLEWVRNTCAGVSENQHLACELRAHISINNLLSTLIEYRSRTFDESIRSESTAVINLGIQALANMCTANPRVQARIWPLFASESSLLSLFLMHATNPKETKYALIWIYNCTLGNRQNCLMLVDSVPGSDVVACLLNIFADATGMHENEFDLAYACIKNLIVSDLVPMIWKSIDQIQENGMSSAHVSLLKALDGYVNTDASRIQDSLPQTTTHILSIFNKTTNSFCRLANASNSVADAFNLNGTNMLMDASIEHFAPFFVLILQYLSATSQSASITEKNKWVDNGVAQSLVDLLDAVCKIQPVILSKPSSKSDQSNQPAQTNAFFMLRCDIVRVISNVSYNCRKAQDAVRNTQSGIPLILSQCVLDDLNPFLREQALFAVRNLTMGNSETQALIASLEAQQVVPNEMLDEIGVRARVDPITGKLKLDR